MSGRTSSKGVKSAKLITGTIYGAYDKDHRVHYVGSSTNFFERKKQHARRPAKALPIGLELRELQAVELPTTYEIFRAEGWWMVRLLLEGHPIQNTLAEGWPVDVLHNPAKYKEPLFAWAKSKGLWSGDVAEFQTAPEAAIVLGISRQAAARRCRNGSIIGAVKIGNDYHVPAPPRMVSVTEDRVAQRLRVFDAMELFKGGMSAYAAAKQVGIAVSAIYRSALYKQWKAMQN
jgi:hypothetical protein